MKVKDLHKYLEQLIQDGKGEREVKHMYDGFIEEIKKPKELFEEMEADVVGVCSGKAQKGDFLIS